MPPMHLRLSFPTNVPSYNQPRKARRRQGSANGERQNKQDTALKADAPAAERSPSDHRQAQMRDESSPSRNDCREDVHFSEEPYYDIDVVDRIGSGDAYVAGALYGLLQHRTIEAMAKYGDAMAAIKNTVMGDMTETDLSDVERIIAAHDSKGPKNEMQR